MPRIEIPGQPQVVMPNLMNDTQLVSLVAATLYAGGAVGVSTSLDASVEGAIEIVAKVHARVSAGDLKARVDLYRAAHVT